jgi:hypothetical protein
MDASDVRRTVRVIEWAIIGRVFYGQKGRGGKALFELLYIMSCIEEWRAYREGVSMVTGPLKYVVFFKLG